MNDEVLNLYKQVGETPLERLNRFRIEKPEYGNAILSYAGRLDPLAEGVLIVLRGDQTKIQKDYFKLDKEYEVEVLFGFYTDTYDVLGLVKSDDSNYDLKDFEKVKTTLIGRREEEYPAYSSKSVLGKPLFFWARHNRLSEIEIPKRIIRIDSIDFLETKALSKNELEKIVKERVLKVNGNFRQQEIINTWEKEIQTHKFESFDILKLKVVCGEGAYMRTLAEKLGILMGSRALAFSIKRTKVGDYKIEDSIR